MRIIFFLVSALAVFLLVFPPVFCQSETVGTGTGTRPSVPSSSPADGTVLSSDPVSVGFLPGWDDGYAVTLLLDGEETVLPLSDVLTGILLAELPAGFSYETRCAQAVAARTYLLYRIRHGLPVSGDSGVCCAYFTEEEGKDFWGELWERALARARKAVSATDGEVLLWEGEPACTVFHAMSWERTENAENVWGYPVPYLVSVPTPEPPDLAGMRREYLFSAETLAEMTGQPLPLSAEPIRDDDGSITAVSLGGTVYPRTALRSLLGLRSARITEAEQTENGLRLVTAGYGHGVGMSQYGAQEMALSGKSYREILAHYYPGLVLAFFPAV